MCLLIAGYNPDAPPPSPPLPRARPAVVADEPERVLCAHRIGIRKPKRCGKLAQEGSPFCRGHDPAWRCKARGCPHVRLDNSIFCWRHQPTTKLEIEMYAMIDRSQARG